MDAQDFWANSERAREEVAKLKHAKAIVEPIDKLDARFGDLDAVAELAKEAGEEDLEAEMRTTVDAIEAELGKLEFRVMLGGEHDHRGAFLSIQAGAGGTEACDWAEMLMRMYLRWCERNGYKVEEIDRTNAEEAGIRWVTLQVTGDYAYGYLKAEVGVHRLVRISPFDSAKRRQTSFAAVDATPVFEEEAPIEIDESELEIETMRSGGAGGQYVNKTESAIRMTHIPTGLVVKCQNQRSQHKNRAMALKLLAAKLARKREAERDKEVKALYGEKGDISFGSQIRSYVLDDRFVKDHRTNWKSNQPEQVLDGDIDEFVKEYLRQRTAKAAAPAAPEKSP